MKSRFLMLAILLICSFSATAQSKRFTVELRVQGEPSFESDMRSYISRELRSLGDVDIVASGNFRILVTAFQDTTKTGAPLGYSVSANYIENIVCDGKVYNNFLTGFLFGGGKDDLRLMSSKIVTGFDTQVLEKQR